jgi:hypothetical protein
MVDQIVILHIHICREKASFSGWWMSGPVCLREEITNWEFTLALTNVRSSAEDGITDRQCAIPIGSS